MEVVKDGSKQTSDSEPCSVRELLHELENEGLIDVVIVGHTSSRPSLDAGGQDHYIIKSISDADANVLKYMQQSSNVRFSNVASLFDIAQIRKSPMLIMSWRVSMDQANMEISPKKPLFYAKEALSLEKDQVIRLV